jgi:hypothetical protein
METGVFHTPTSPFTTYRNRRNSITSSPMRASKYYLNCFFTMLCFLSFVCRLEANADFEESAATSHLSPAYQAREKLYQVCIILCGFLVLTSNLPRM